MSTFLATKMWEGNSDSSMYVREECVPYKKQAGCQSKFVKIKTVILNNFSAILVVKILYWAALFSEERRTATSL